MEKSNLQDGHILCLRGGTGECREPWDSIEDGQTYMVIIFSVLQVALGV
jgi:hypothetical protein